MVHVNSKHVKKLILPIDMTADVHRQKARESKVSLRNMTVEKSHYDLVTAMNMRPINDDLQKLQMPSFEIGPIFHQIQIYEMNLRASQCLSVFTSIDVQLCHSIHKRSILIFKTEICYFCIFLGPRPESLFVQVASL